VGEYVQEPTDEPFYAYDESGVGIYVQEDFSKPTPDSIQEDSTLGINEESYGYDALGNYVQGDILESAPPEASTFNEPMYDYDAPPEASTIGTNEPSYGYDAWNYVQGGILESAPPEVSTFGTDEPMYGNDAWGNYVQGGVLESPPTNEPIYGYDALGNYVLIEPMPGNTQNTRNCDELPESSLRAPISNSP
jgi:hypothetical protein